MKIKTNYSLKELNTFQLNVHAKLFIEIFNENELEEILREPKYVNEEKLILGGGSNILFSKDYDGLVIKISIPGIKIVKEDNDSIFVEAGAGIIWDDLVRYAVNNSFGGIENLSLIPGTAGAAPVQNIGAYGQELKDVFYELKGFYKRNADRAVFNKEDCNFGYRYSVFKAGLKNKFIITSVTLKLSKKPILNLDYGSIRNEIEKEKLKEVSLKNIRYLVSKIRKNKLPDPADIGNAGSFFKNPEIPYSKFEELKIKFPEITGYKISDEKMKISAGWLIEKAGMKGIREGNTGTHKRQSLVIVNYDNADGEEIIRFANKIKVKIYEKFKIELEEEVNIV